ncbi:uncharacterized protein LOC108670235 [Hyalella azteca]|uniref:Uncharacterized protein LOC108670235 n=1 Tax=Hyalella azteca TaxID=294128 RepID=A0A8B7NHS2_HYAAZ|nr:uncharacterized protein LOC108670235 [Hyalella azteca]
MEPATSNGQPSTSATERRVRFFQDYSVSPTPLFNRALVKQNMFMFSPNASTIDRITELRQEVFEKVEEYFKMMPMDEVHLVTKEMYFQFTKYHRILCEGLNFTEEDLTRLTDSELAIALDGMKKIEDIERFIQFCPIMQALRLRLQEQCIDYVEIVKELGEAYKRVLLKLEMLQNFTRKRSSQPHVML